MMITAIINGGEDMSLTIFLYSVLASLIANYIYEKYSK